MASSLSDYQESAWLALIRAGSTWLALFTDTNTAVQRDAGTVTEVAGGGYARQPVTWAAPLSPGGTMAQSGALAFPTATTDWTTITAVGVYDALTAGHLLWWGDLTVPRAVPSGATFTIADGAVVLTLS